LIFKFVSRHLSESALAQEETVEELLNLAEEKLVPVLKELFSAAQQLDMRSMLRDLPHILEKNGVCRFTPQSVTDFSSTADQLMMSLDKVAADQLAGLQLLLQSGGHASNEEDRRPLKEMENRADIHTPSVAASKGQDGAPQLLHVDGAQFPSLDAFQLLNLADVRLPSMDGVQLPSMADVQLSYMGDVQLPSLADLKLPSWEEVKLPTVQGITNFLTAPNSPVIYTLRHAS
jgi:hypothetical protein